MRHLHALVPESVGDPRWPSGGNTYDRRLGTALAERGWVVEEHRVPGQWPEPDQIAQQALDDVTSRLPDGGVVLVDGLIASLSSEVMVPLTGRLRVAVLVHLPLGGPREQAVLSAAAAVITTSRWTRDRLLTVPGLDPRRVHVAEPGVDRAPLAPGTLAGGELLCVAAVTPDKGHELLVTALASLSALPWGCVCAGPLDRDPRFVEAVTDLARRAGVADRIRFAGPLSPGALGRAYAAADVLVHPSRVETYGMVVTEALAHGLPVIASATGGLPDALGLAGADRPGADAPDGSRAQDGVMEDRRPGLLVPSDDAAALAAAVRLWLTAPDLRAELRRRAAHRRLDLQPWSHPAAQVSSVLEALFRR